MEMDKMFLNVMTVFWISNGRITKCFECFDIGNAFFFFGVFLRKYFKHQMVDRADFHQSFDTCYSEYLTEYITQYFEY